VLRLRMPERCQFCGALGSVRLEQTDQGTIRHAQMVL
jgi:hypothetical protein